jgi:hypothetical protein
LATKRAAQAGKLLRPFGDFFQVFDGSAAT